MSWNDAGSRPLIPVRILNEYVYCPRLAYLMWIQKEWADSEDTIRGKMEHGRVDKEEGDLLPAPEELPDDLRARSVHLTDEDLGLTGIIDLVDVEGGEVSPVDYKHGSRPEGEPGYWDTDAVQLGAQAMLLRAAGYRVSEGVIYYVGSKERVRVPITDELILKVKEAIEGVRKIAAKPAPPPPLEGSNKCYGCSLVGICLPDETNVLAQGRITDGEVRRLYPILGDAQPLYVSSQGARVGRSGETLVVKTKEGEKREVPLIYVSHLAVFGGVSISTQAISALMRAGIPVVYFTSGGWFYGITHGMMSKNVVLRIAQFKKAGDLAECIRIARRLVWAKIKNSRTMLRRNNPNVEKQVLVELDRLSKRALKASSLETLLGIEGTAAHVYFGSFQGMLKPKGFEEEIAFNFRNRNRRPPKDPVNALLSLVYALMTKEFTVVLMSVGFDPYMGFYHQPKYGKPALALDLMEEFRPIVGDSVVLNMINNGEIQASDFVWTGSGVALKGRARKKVIEAYERRLNVVIRHPVFGYKVSYRKLFEVQARLFARYVMGEIKEYPAVIPR